jgi:hypothetical protein
MLDVDVVTAAFGSHPQHFRWNARVDMDNNRIINIKDMALVAQDFGEQ